VIFIGGGSGRADCATELPARIGDAKAAAPPNPAVCKNERRFMDPPYSMRYAYKVTLDAVNHSSLSECALLIAEHEKRFDPGDQFGEMQRFHTRLQGDAGLSFYRRT